MERLATVAMMMAIGFVFGYYRISLFQRGSDGRIKMCANPNVHTRGAEVEVQTQRPTIRQPVMWRGAKYKIGPFLKPTKDTSGARTS
eukprot:scaffold18699_cov125-Cylindrotheca_fusiformis.AAC.2